MKKVNILNNIDKFIFWILTITCVVSFVVIIFQTQFAKNYEGIVIFIMLFSYFTLLIWMNRDCISKKFYNNGKIKAKWFYIINLCFLIGLILYYFKVYSKNYDEISKSMEKL